MAKALPCTPPAIAMRAAIETAASMGMALIAGPMVNDTRESSGAVKCTVMAFTCMRMVEPMKVNGWRVSNTDKAKEHGPTGDGGG